MDTLFQLLERMVRWHPDLVNPERLAAVLDEAGRSRDIERIIAALGDTTTMVQSRSTQADKAGVTLPTDWSMVTLTDGTPVLSVTDAFHFQDESLQRSLATVLRDALTAKALILDLRFRRLPLPTEVSPLLDFLRNICPGGDVRFRAHIGFESEDRKDSGDYRSEWRVRRLPGGQPVKLGVVINANTPSLLPLIAAARDGYLICLAQGSRLQSKHVYGLPFTTINVNKASILLRTASEVSVLTGIVSITDAPDPTLYTSLSKMLLTGLRYASTTGVMTSQPANIPNLPSSATPFAKSIRAQAILSGMYPHLDGPWKPLAVGTQGHETTDALIAQNARQIATSIHDGHAVVRHQSQSLGTNMPVGLRFRNLDSKVVVVNRYGLTPYIVGIDLGDILLRIDGQPVEAVMREIAQSVSFATQQAHKLYICNRLCVGPEGTIVKLEFERGRKRFIVEMPRLTSSEVGDRLRERTKDVTRLITPMIGYIDLDVLYPEIFDAALKRVAQADRWIVDARGQGNAAAWQLAPLLTKQRLVAAICETRIDLADLGGLREEQLRRTLLTVEPSSKARLRRVAVLVDERTQSQSEISVMLFKACGATVVGSPTAGAVGDVTDIRMDDRVRLSFSGQTVKTPAGASVHGRGVAIDVRIKQTPAATASGRDLQMEAALKILKY